MSVRMRMRVCVCECVRGLAYACACSMHLCLCGAQIAEHGGCDEVRIMHVVCSRMWRMHQCIHASYHNERRRKPHPRHTPKPNSSFKLPLFLKPISTQSQVGPAN